ncbi:hypothetical protein FOFC_18245 [Fusarium oxysporum]|nr:hypothetical protein FOFC_18245 [Fusarium oxysporum]
MCALSGKQAQLPYQRCSHSSLEANAEGRSIKYIQASASFINTDWLIDE